MNKLLLLMPLFFIIPLAYGAEIPHAFDEVTTAKTHTGNTDWTDIPNISLTSGNFTTGNKYLLIFQAELTGSSASTNSGIRAVHGSTEFANSEMNQETFNVGYYNSYTFFTVWTAVSSEEVKMQFSVKDSATTVTADQLSITAIEISEDLIEDTDWYFDSRTASDSLSTSFTTTNPSVTFTPNGSDDWLVMANSQIKPTAADNFESRINLDDTTLTPLHSQEGEDATNDRQYHFLARVYTPDNTEHTFETDARFDGGFSGSREYSSIFALNLDKFDVHADNYITLDSSQDSGNTLTGTPTQENTLTIEPNGSGDVFIMSFSIYDGGAISYQQIRQQVANSDQPPTQTNDDYRQSIHYDSTDQHHWVISTIESLSASTVIDMDTSNTVGTRELRDSQIVAFTMELSGGVPPTPPDSINDLTSTSIGLTSVDLDWSEPNLQSQSLIGYQINYTTPQSQTVKTTGIIFLNDTGTIDDTITGLSPSTDYSATVSAWTIAGNNATLANVYNFTTASPSGKYIWFNVSPATNGTLGGIFAFECPSTQFVRGFYEDGTAICATP